MSRVEENRMWIESVPSSLTGNPQDVSCKLEAYKLQALVDISRSLAIIANDKDIAFEADAYVRDHLLIKFMKLYFIEEEYEIENLYKEWIDWLKRQEGKHND